MRAAPAGRATERSGTEREPDAYECFSMSVSTPARRSRWEARCDVDPGIPLWTARVLPARVVAAFPAVLAPVADRLVAMGVRPNAITAASLVVLAGAGAAYGLGGARLGAIFLLLSGTFDVLDGLVARRGGMVSAFGGFLDSTLDRVGDALLLIGIALSFQAVDGDVVPAVGAGVCLAALAGSLIVSYTAALGDALGIQCRVGLAQRAERVLGIGVPTLVLGAGPDGIVLLLVVAVLAVMAWVTVAQRARCVLLATRAADERSGAAGAALAPRTSVGRPAE